MKVAVTGGSGVVGRSVVRRLKHEGHEVTALARSVGSLQVLDGLGAAVVTGDLLDPHVLDRLVSGNEVVFHVAGVNELCLRDPTRMWRANVEGSVAVLDACERNRVRRLVHTSSAVTIGEERGITADESTKHRGHFLSEYERSKTVAERLVLDRAGKVEVVSVNPSSVQGPGRSSGTGAILLAIARGTTPLLVDATISLVDIDDCARGHLLAAERGMSGERYILSGAVLDIRTGVEMINRLRGRKTRPRFVKPSVVRALAPIAAGVSRLTGREVPLCPESVRVLLAGHRYDGTRVTRELGLEYTDLGETLHRTLHWFEEEGLL
ncbi:MAG TPA: NAD-dependent epimerase/dehydratase family protein [Acidimicrobiia bacterium]|nr:NAD-dependent epimerase/dehydratase family protein [Acidimicrobiia bacterium]